MIDTFGTRLKGLRGEKKLTQIELSKIFVKSESAVRMWELGRAKPDVDTLIELSEFFNVSVDYLLGISDVRNPDEKKELEEGSLKVSSLFENIPIKYKKDALNLITNLLNGVISLEKLPGTLKSYLCLLQGMVEQINLCAEFQNKVTGEKDDYSSFVKNIQFLDAKNKVQKNVEKFFDENYPVPDGITLVKSLNSFLINEVK